MSVRLVRRGEGDLYRVYRPLRFGEFYGPTRRAAVPLVNQIIRTGRLEKQSYLISGFSGSGKTTLALTIAMALNCKNRQPNARSGELIEPCLVCDHCQRALSGLVAPLSTSALSFHNASSINKESVEDIINNELKAGRPILGEPYRIVVFDEAHDLTGVQAAPLKIPLENLARSVYVFFLTDQPELFLKRDAALQSRVSHVHIPLWSHEEITELLANMVTNEYEKNNRPLLDPSALAHIANIAAGNPRRAISSLEIVLNGVASNVSTITAAHVKTYYPDLGELDEADHNNKALLDLFSAIRDSNMEKALGSIAAMEKKRENAVTIIYKVNKYLKNRVVENAARNKTVMLEFARKLRNFGMAFNRDGEPYANLMCGVVAALEG